MKNSPFYQQAELMLRMLSFVAQEKCFALKGGTAINLFLRDMPRLSVDIDLTYLPIEPREQSLQNIHAALARIEESARKVIPGLQFHSSGGQEYKLFVQHKGVRIKIEPNTVLRGVVYPSREMLLCGKAQELFGMSVSVNLLSFADLYGGKICAALDRQHPRDIFDVKLLMDNEGITEEVRKAFVVYLASHDRPMHELLDPKRKDIRQAFESEFSDMTSVPVSYDDLLASREKMIEAIRSSLTQLEREFLLSVKSGNPSWDLMGIDGLDKLPGIQWKLYNIGRMTAKKNREYHEKLKQLLREQ